MILSFDTNHIFLGENGVTTLSKSRSHLRAVSEKKKFTLPEKKLIQIHDCMVKARAVEERLIKMYKQSDGYFWIGGPGEEAFNIPLGMQVNKGQGLDHDYLHLHYRSSGILIGMGILNPRDAFRQMKNTATDPYSGGRNFANHYSFREYNVPPISSTIGTQYATAIGSGIAHKRHGGKGITIVNGGDAGSAEGEFASCLVWASRPGNELPMLIIVVDNGWGISTAAETQHGEEFISDRAKAFRMKAKVFNGNDVEESYSAIEEAMEYIRTERKPYFLEAKTSRLYGHSSASGANFKSHEEDPIVTFEAQLENAGILSKKQMTEVKKKYEEEFLAIAKEVREEPLPDGSTIYDYVYWNQKGKYW